MSLKIQEKGLSKYIFFIAASLFVVKLHAIENVFTILILSQIGQGQLIIPRPFDLLT
jgi:hypothetical protein